MAGTDIAGMGVAGTGVATKVGAREGCDRDESGRTGLSRDGPVLGNTWPRRPVSVAETAGTGNEFWQLGHQRRYDQDGRGRDGRGHKRWRQGRAWSGWAADSDQDYDCAGGEMHLSPSVTVAVVVKAWDKKVAVASRDG